MKARDESVTIFAYLTDCCRKSTKILLVVPRSMRRSIVTEYHDNNSHVGYDKTVTAIRENYWFRKLNDFVKKYIKNCLVCIQHNPKIRKDGFMHIYDRGDSPFKILHIGHLGPLERTSVGNKFVLVVVDAFSKFMFLRPAKSTDSGSVVSSLTEVFSTFGNPGIIVSDRDSAFTSSEFESFCATRNIRHIKISVSTPHANGHVERYDVQ